jgi:hypothetical protein
MAENKLLSAVSFGPVEIGESRIPINLNDFWILPIIESNIVQAKFVQESVQWIRTKNNLLTPRARLRISVKSTATNMHIKYLNQTIILAKRNDQLYTELYINLFSPGDIDIYQGDKKIETYTVEAKNKRKDQETQVIDYSCAKYGLEVVGLDNEYISLGCRLERLGKWSKSRPRLEVTWTATNFRLADGSPPPYVAFLHDSSPLELTLFNPRGETRKMFIKTKLPKRLRRLKTAWGIGPYPFTAEQSGTKKDWKITPALFLYGKFEFTEDTTTSFKFFNGLLYNGTSLFNNAGLYFSYEIATALDHRISFSPLIGAQVLTFKFDQNFDTNTDLIYPQGLEVAYRHAFGIKNYSIVYGMFLPFSDNDKYNNVWLRWGKGYFWEVNYIGWESDGRKSSTYGLSIGLPLASFL